MLMIFNNHLKMIRRVSKIVWIVLNFIALALSLYPYGTHYNQESGIILYYLMWPLSFPLGTILFPFLTALAIGMDYFSFSIPDFNTYWGHVILWLCFFALGYLQWFKIVPFLVVKVSTLYHRSK